MAPPMLPPRAVAAKRSGGIQKKDVCMNEKKLLGDGKATDERDAAAVDAGVRESPDMPWMIRGAR